MKNIFIVVAEQDAAKKYAVQFAESEARGKAYEGIAAAEKEQAEALADAEKKAEALADALAEHKAFGAKTPDAVTTKEQAAKYEEKAAKAEKALADYNFDSRLADAEKAFEEAKEQEKAARQTKSRARKAEKKEQAAAALEKAEKESQRRGDAVNAIRAKYNSLREAAESARADAEKAKKQAAEIERLQNMRAEADAKAEEKAEAAKKARQTGRRVNDFFSADRAFSKRLCSFAFSLMRPIDIDYAAKQERAEAAAVLADAEKKHAAALAVLRSAKAEEKQAARDAAKDTRDALSAALEAAEAVEKKAKEARAAAKLERTATEKQILQAYKAGRGDLVMIGVRKLLQEYGLETSKDWYVLQRIETALAFESERQKKGGRLALAMAEAERLHKAPETMEKYWRTDVLDVIYGVLLEEAAKKGTVKRQSLYEAFVSEGVREAWSKREADAAKKKQEKEEKKAKQKKAEEKAAADDMKKEQEKEQERANVAKHAAALEEQAK